MNLRGNTLLKIGDRYIGIALVWAIGLLLKIMPKRQPASVPRCICIIKLSALGDSILLIPALTAIKQAYPGAQMLSVCTGINEAVFKNISCIDEVISLEVKKCIRNPVYLLKIMLFLRRKKIDIAFDFDQWLKISPLIGVLAGSKQFVGFKTAGQYRHYVYSSYVDHPQGKHELEAFLMLVETVTGSKAATKLQFPVSGNELKIAIEMLHAGGYTDQMFLLAVHPGCGSHGWQREWPPEKYIELLTRLKGKNIYCVFTGSSSERHLIERIMKKLNGIPLSSVIDASILYLSSLLSACDCLVSGNTGIMHLSSAVGTPCVALHGPTDPDKWGPYGASHHIIKAPIGCSPCLYLGFEYGCDTNTCMHSIDVDTVYEKIISLIS